MKHYHASRRYASSLERPAPRARIYAIWLGVGFAVIWLCVIAALARKWGVL